MNFCNTKITHMGFVVEDLMASIKEYHDKFGIGPWDILTFDERYIENVVLDGKEYPSYRIQISFCPNCPNLPCSMELIQPLDDRSTFAKYLREHGPGLHHLGIECKESYETVLKFMELQGMRIEQAALVSKGEACYFVDATKQFGTYFELQGRVADFTPPGPDATYP